MKQKEVRVSMNTEVSHGNQVEAKEATKDDVLIAKAQRLAVERELKNIRLARHLKQYEGSSARRETVSVAAAAKFEAKNQERHTKLREWIKNEAASEHKWYQQARARAVSC